MLYEVITVGLQHLEIGLGGLVILARPGVLLEQAGLAGEGEARLRERGDLGGALGLDQREVGLGVAQGVLLGEGIDFGDELAFLDFVAEFDSYNFV